MGYKAKVAIVLTAVIVTMHGVSFLYKRFGSSGRKSMTKKDGKNLLDDVHTGGIDDEKCKDPR